jgi:excisionase family DNA binding protein
MRTQVVNLAIGVIDERYRGVSKCPARWRNPRIKVKQLELIDLIAAIQQVEPSDMPAILAAVASRLAESRAAPAPPANGKPALVDATELARELSVPESQLMTLARQGRVPSVMIGKYRRFNLAAVEAALRNVDKS